MSTDRDEALTTLLEGAGAAHHDAFLHVDGADPEWASWYASFLLKDLGSAVGQVLEHAALRDLLAAAQEAHSSQAPGTDWAPWYASYLSERL